VVIMPWQARWFDGRSSRVHAVTVSVDGNALTISAAAPDGPALGAPSMVRTDRLSIGERFLGVSRMIGLPDGSSLQVHDDAALGFDQALRGAGHRSGHVYRLMERWSSVVACVVVLIALVVWLDRQGAGLIASAAVRVVPTSIDQRIGSSALAIADAQWLAPTQLPPARSAALHRRFASLVREQYPDLIWRLEFRTTRGEKGSFNAFALPDGTIVVLDGLVEKMDDEEVLAVLGHELGHVLHRDVMHGILCQMGLLAVAGVVWGNMSSVAASVEAGVQGLHFAREAESEADAFAVTFLRRGGIPVRRLADAFTVMKKQEKATGEMPTFLSDHPSTPERLRAAQAAAESPPSGNSRAQRD
jgi:Zn-dependent protease with chaperone function